METINKIITNQIFCVKLSLLLLITFKYSKHFEKYIYTY